MTERMKLERVRRFFVRGAALTGLAGLALLGGVGTQLGLLGLALVAAAWAFAGERLRRRQIWAVASALVSLATVVAPILFGLPWSWAGMGLLVYLQVHRACVAQTTADDRLTVLFGLLMVLLACTRARSPALGLLLVLLVGGMPLALVVLHLVDLEKAHATRREALAEGGRAWRFALLAPASVALTAFFFAVIPRLSAEVLSEYGDKQDLSGFDEGVELGDIGEIKDNPELVMRVTVTDSDGDVLPGPFYFRGLALDRFDGGSWTVGESLRDRQRPSDLARDPGGPPEAGALRQDVLLEPVSGAPIFAIAPVDRIFADEFVYSDQKSGFRWGEDVRRREFVVVSLPDEPILDGFGTFRDPELKSLPPDLDPRILELAERLAGEVDAPRAKAAAIEQYLRQNHRYTLVPTPATANQALAVFLFDSRQGHCEYFATALAVLLRAQGVPARLVNGFYGGDFNPVGGFIAVRQAHAHSWVEAWMPGEGWVRFDATPAGEVAAAPGGLLGQLGDALSAQWYGFVLDYDLATQLQGVRAVGRQVQAVGGPAASTGVAPGALGAGVLVVGLLVAAGAASRLARGWLEGRRRRPRGVAAVHARARKLVAKKGWQPPASMPPVEAARWLREEAGEGAEPLEELAWLLYRARYAEEPEAGLLPAARAALARLDRDLPGAQP